MVFHAFDLLYLDGRDLRGAALLDRKALLAPALDDAPAGGVRATERASGGRRRARSSATPADSASKA